MYAEERRQAIADQTRRDGRVEVATLADTLGVTPETVRRDLTDLERRGVLRRVHGGAIPTVSTVGEPALDDKTSVMSTEKRRIANAGLAMVPDRGRILLDAGTTTGELAALLPDRELTVVTNALPIATVLATRGQLTVLTLGGRVRGRTMAMVGAWAMRTIDDLEIDIAFVATNGIDVDRGLSTHDPAEAEMKAAMIARARRTVLLADSSKFGASHFVRYAHLSQLDVIVTDSGLDPSFMDAVEAAGPRVVIA